MGSIRKSARMVKGGPQQQTLAEQQYWDRNELMEVNLAWKTGLPLPIHVVVLDGHQPLAAAIRSIHSTVNGIELVIQLMEEPAGSDG